MKCKYCKLKLGHERTCPLIVISNETKENPYYFFYEGLEYVSLYTPVKFPYSFHFIYTKKEFENV